MATLTIAAGKDGVYRYNWKLNAAPGASASAIVRELSSSCMKNLFSSSLVMLMLGKETNVSLAVATERKERSTVEGL